MRSARSLVLALVSLGGSSLFPAPVHANWEFQLAPYLWAAGIEGDVTLLGSTAEVDEGFSDVLNILDGGGMLHFEAAHAKWAILSDLFFIDLGADLEKPAGKMDYEQWIVETAGAYAVAEQFDLLFGVRYTRVDGELRLSGPLMLNPQGDQSWTDPFVGVRWMADFGDHWGLGVRGDVGGFGAGSDFTWQVRATGIYRFSPRVFLGLGLRVLDQDFEDGEGLRRFAYDVTMAGAELGVGFEF